MIPEALVLLYSAVPYTYHLSIDMVVDDALPSYTREDSNLQIRSDGPGGAPSHECSLESKGTKWLKLIIKNSRAASTRSLPIFNDGDAITGTVEVDLDKPDGIKSVAVALLGGTTSVGQEEVRFLTEEQLLWASTANDGPLRGQNSWSFSITIPSELPVASKYNGRPGEKYRLPPTFSERASPVYIDYKIVVRVKRGVLRAQSILTQTIGFIPQSTGEVPSSHRQKAYAAGAPLPGPDVDPEGWKVLPGIPMKGTLFGSREVEIQCQLALSVPLTYAVGSRVHLFLTLSGQDQQAIDLLCSHGASRIFLVRSVMAVSPGSKSRSDNTFKTSSSRALVWRIDDAALEGAGSSETTFKRTLQGEIEVKHASTPTFNFPTVSITYEIVLLPFRAPGFVPASNTDQPLLSEQVKIVTSSPPGTAPPRSYAPPGYEMPDEGNYNNVMGVLENGNQRFLNHHALS